MLICYAHSDIAWFGLVPFLKNCIYRNNAKKILEVGAGANPTLPREFINQNNLNYSLLDISSEELAKAPPGYATIVADIGARDMTIWDEYDFVFSRMLAEHMKSGEIFHRNIFRLLSKNGIACHFFPTLFAPPFIVNWLMPERLTRLFLKIIQSGRETKGKHAKFPAYYSWCCGPTALQIRRFEKIGYKIEEYVGFFGHDGYYRKQPALVKLHRKLSFNLVNRPVPWLTSFAYVVLSKFVSVAV